MPDLYWERSETDETLDAILQRMKQHKCLVWFAEDEHINKALGPFRRQKQREEHIHTAVLGISPGRRDLRLRARSIQGMTQLRKVHFPKFASWWPEAENELLKFPSAAHDDFVSFLALIGLGLDSQTMAIVPKREGNVYHTGTFGWMKMRAKQDARREKFKKATAGM
jgi:predicted phage terminase large subunit-like protein